ncbi:MAG: fibrobacter succinogenes major paralogous domain-containing protein [Bacteroidota bacterium]
MKRFIFLFALVCLVFSTHSSFSQAQKSKKDKILSNNVNIITFNSGEALCPGTVVQIQWDGVPASDTVKLEYSTNGGTDWIMITDTANGLSFNWTVPNTVSENCVVRVRAKESVTPTYEEVTIGTQTWMLKNLDVVTYRNGDTIPEVSGNGAWKSLGTGAWCYYNNDSANRAIYGRIYNGWAVIDPRGLAPEGWHIPSDDEWKILEMYLGMTQTEADKPNWRGTTEGGKLRETGIVHWNNPNSDATNEVGFTALPGGTRDYFSGTFANIRINGYWWSTTWYAYQSYYCRGLNYGTAQVLRSAGYLQYGFSVRCVKD